MTSTSKRAPATLFKRIEAGDVTVFAPITTIADCVYVLSSQSLYKLPRTEVVGLLLPILRLRGFRVQDRRAVLRALDLYAATALWISAMPISPQRCSVWDREPSTRLTGIMIESKGFNA